MDDRPRWERELDVLVRPALVVDPPADVQRSILAAVLRAAAAPARPAMAAAAPAMAPLSPGAVPLAAYLLLAAVLVAYVAAVSWVDGLLGGGAWLPTLLTQLLAASSTLVGRPTVDDPLGLVWLLVERAPWLALLPVGWLLWERDRAAARAA
jgi:hypothetical protein